MSGKIKRILFVCYGNTCRSPMAEAVFKDMVEKRALRSEYEVDSVGLSNWQEGQQPNRHVTSILLRNKIEYIHSARQLTVADIVNSEYIFGMDMYNIYEINRFVVETGSQANVRLLGEFDTETADKIIPDPYFDNNQDDFEKCFVKINKCCNLLLNDLLQQKNI